MFMKTRTKNKKQTKTHDFHKIIKAIKLIRFISCHTTMLKKQRETEKSEYF